MLILSRKPGESITFETSDGPILVMLCHTEGSKTRLGIEAPQSVSIARTELLHPDYAERKRADRAAQAQQSNTADAD